MNSADIADIADAGTVQSRALSVASSPGMSVGPRQVGLAPPENRDAEGRFQPGLSGNPGGRPRKVRELRKAIDEVHTAEKVLAVVDKLQQLALGGDVAAIKLYLDRTVGPVRPRPEDELDLTNAPTEVLEWLLTNLR